MSFVKTGTPKQAKYAVRCIDAMCRSKDVIFKQLFEVYLIVCVCVDSVTKNSAQCNELNSAQCNELNSAQCNELNSAMCSFDHNPAWLHNYMF